MKKQLGDSCKLGWSQLRMGGAAGWVATKNPFARQLLRLRTCGSRTASDIIHEDAESMSFGKAETTNVNSTIPVSSQNAFETLVAKRDTCHHLLCNHLLISCHDQPSRWSPMISRSSSVEAKASTSSGSSEESAASGRRAFRISR